MKIRRADERGVTELGWLHSRHTFSFGDYHDPAFTRYRTLRVINDDVVEPGQGFGMHGHRDMEIISIVLEGALEHKDSLGNGEVLRPGEVQVMSAGRGVRHSEFNPSRDERVRLLQVWIFPAERGIDPAYAQKAFPRPARLDRLVRVAGPARVGDDGALPVHQDADLFLAALSAGGRAEHVLRAGRGAWVHVAVGEATVNGTALREGDAAAIEGPATVELHSSRGSDVLVFDLE
ncbi:MAG: pirin family protein [Phycisphaerales bacterium]